MVMQLVVFFLKKTEVLLACLTVIETEVLLACLTVIEEYNKKNRKQ
jgi:hypothetical protein